MLKLHKLKRLILIITILIEQLYSKNILIENKNQKTRKLQNENSNIFNNNDFDFTYDFKNSFAPYTLYCGLSCKFSNFPTDEEIINQPASKESFSLRFFKQEYSTSTEIPNLNFNNLYRNSPYKLRCISKGNTADKISSQNLTSINSQDLIIKNSRNINCVRYSIGNFNTFDKTQTIKACQSLLSFYYLTNWKDKGCPICSDERFSINSEDPQYNLRNYYAEINNTNIDTTDTTVGICFPSHPTCETEINVVDLNDNTDNKAYLDKFIQKVFNPNIGSYADYKEYFTIPTPENLKCPFTERNFNNFNFQGDLLKTLLGNEKLYETNGNKTLINFTNVENLSNNIDNKFSSNQFSSNEILDLSLELTQQVDNLINIAKENYQNLDNKSLLDLINTEILLELAGKIINTESLNSDNDNNTIFTYSSDDKVTVTNNQNQTFSTEVSVTDKSTVGLISNKSITVVKSHVEDITDLLVIQEVNENKNSTAYINKNFDGSFFYIQIYSDNEIKNKEKFQKENGLSIITYHQCAKDLKIYYDFDKDIIIGKIDWDPKLSAKRNFADVSIIYYNPDTGKEIKEEIYREICNNKTLDIKYSLKDIPIDEKEYLLYYNKTFNIYDADSPFYLSRCTPLKNETSKGDISMNTRLVSIYKNLTLSCGSYCTFEKIEDNYINCKCKDLKKGEAKGFLRDLDVSPYSVLNLGIVTCYGVLREVFIFLKFFLAQFTR